MRSAAQDSASEKGLKESKSKYPGSLQGYISGREFLVDKEGSGVAGSWTVEQNSRADGTV